MVTTIDAFGTGNIAKANKAGQRITLVSIYNIQAVTLAYQNQELPCFLHYGMGRHTIHNERAKIFKVRGSHAQHSGAGIAFNTSKSRVTFVSAAKVL